MFTGSDAHSRAGRRHRAWAEEMNAEVARAYPGVCNRSLERLLEIRESPRGGDGTFVRNGRRVPRHSILGVYPGEVATLVEEDEVRQKYAIALPVFKVEPGGPDVILEVNGRPAGGPPFGIADASVYNNVCGDRNGTVRMFWHTLGPGRPAILMAMAARDLVGGDELVWPYGRQYSLEDVQGQRMNAKEPGSVVRCKCAVPRACPFQRWMWT